jgi:hypothetical protein
MHGTTCIFWATVTPFSLQGLCTVVEAAASGEAGAATGLQEGIAAAFETKRETKPSAGHAISATATARNSPRARAPQG